MPLTSSFSFMCREAAGKQCKRDSSLFRLYADDSEVSDIHANMEAIDFFNKKRGLRIIDQ
jgi:hypothetical protein